MQSAKLRLYSNSSLYTGLVAGVTFSLVSLGNAYANPTGATVVSGQVSVSQTGSNEIITQATNTAIINWQSFNILSGESTRFIQPSSSSIALNRVTSGSPTEILGSLSANGHLMIINSAGIIFGAGSHVNVAGLIASTADISNKNFNAGIYNFSSPGKPDASIINKGTITAADGGLVALVAPNVRNSGVINAHVGTVALGAAQTFSIDFYGDNLFSFALGTPAQNASIINSGKINAQGGNVYLTARAAGSVVNDVINNTGIIDASASHKSKAGNIVIDGGDGNVKIAGNLNVSGKHAGQKGGNISVAGNNVTIASGANLDASGNAGGGSVSVQGLNSVTDAFGSIINASAIDNGNGGSVKLISTNDTEFLGTIVAKGGANGGDGGSVETSGDYLNAAGVVDASAIKGAAGTWLLDPFNILISNDPDNNFTGTSTITASGSPSVVSVATILNELDTGTNVVITTNNPAGNEQGNIEVADTIAYTGNNKSSLKLDANGNIIVDNGVSISSSGSALDVDLEAGGNITLSSNSSIKSDGGNVTLNANDAGANAGYVFLDGGSSITSSGGNITLTGASGDANYGGVEIGNYYGGTGASVNAGGGNITITGQAAGSSTYWDGVDVLAGSTISTTGAGTITIAGTGSNAAGSPNNSLGIWLNNSSVTAVDGDININGTGQQNGVIPSFGIAFDGGTVATTGKGNITLTGTGSSGSAGIISGSDNYGTATIGGTSDNGNITLVADSLSLASDTIQTTKTVTFKPLTAGTTVGLNDAGSSLNITTTLLDTVNAPIVTIGSTIAGALTANSFNYESTLNTLNLIAGNGVNMTDATINTNGGNINITGTSKTDGVAGVTINDSTINADPVALPGGNITISGTGDATGTAGNNNGILISHDSDIFTSGNGKITLTGIAGGAGASGSDTGVNLVGGTISAIDGNINITGTGGNGNGWDEVGVHTSAGTTITTSGKGALNLTGFGGGNGSGTANDQGVSIDGTLSSTSTAKNAGGINLIGYSGDNNGSGQTNAGVVVFGGGKGGALISSVNGDINIEGNTGLLGHAVSTVDGGSTSFPDAGIFVAGGSTISSTGTANITLSGVGANGSGLNQGVFLNNYFGGTTIKTTSGNITINGTAGNANSNGVSIDTADAINAGGKGNVTVIANGNLYDAGSITSNLGSISLIGSNEDFESATVTTQGGNINFDSYTNLFVGGAINVNNSLVTTNGGNITLGGGLFDLFAATSSADGVAGITLTHDFLGAQGGNISINGAGDATGTAGNNDGVAINNATVISTTGNGTINITGIGGGAGNSGNNFGINMTDVGTGVTAQNGTITLIGTGGNTTGNYDIGTSIQSGASVTSNGSGDIKIYGIGGGTGASTDDVGTVVAALNLNDGTGIFSNGTGNITLIGYTGDRNGNGANTNYYDGGVYVNAPISSINGNIEIDANTGISALLLPVSNTTGSGNLGITTYNATDISTTGTGTITLNGVAPSSSTGSNNTGILLQNGATITTNGAAITLNGTSNVGNYGIGLTKGTVSTGNAGAIKFNALNNSDIFNGGTIDSVTGAITLTGNNENLIGGNVSTGGTVELTATGDVTVNSGSITGSSITIDPTNVTLINTSISTPGNGKIDIEATNNITVANSTLTTRSAGGIGGDISLTADTAKAGAGYVLVDDGSVVASNGGDITLHGASGDTNFGGVSIGNFHDGSAATVNAGGGTIKIIGTAATGSTEFDGVDVMNGSQIETTGKGQISLTGYGSTGDDTNAGGGDSAGVWLYNGASVTSQNGGIGITGTAQGTGSVPNYGVIFANGTVATTGSGLIDISGHGSHGADGVVSGNSYFPGSATIGGAQDTGKIIVYGNSLSLLSGSITTTGEVSLGATGDVTIANNTIKGGDVLIDPINVSLSNTSVTTPGKGAIVINASNDITLNDTSLTTQGGKILLASNTTGQKAGAIVIEGGSSLTSNGGNITLGGGNTNGTGSAYGDATATLSLYGGEDGIWIDNSLVSSGKGDISLNGVGGNNGQNSGVEITGTGGLQSTSGDITVTGKGGNTSSYGAYGVALGDGNISSVSGDISITGTGAKTGTGSYGNGIELYDSSSITNTYGKITLNGTAGGTEANYSFGLFSVAGNNIIGGANDKGDIVLDTNPNSSINFINATISTAGNVTVDPRDFTLDASSMTGKNVKIDANNVNLLDDSTITAGNKKGDKLDINNTGIFYSDTSDVLNGYTITFNQNAGSGSSIQNAIDAVGKHNNATLTLGKGTWNEDVVVNKSDFTLTGQGKKSIINATGNNKTVLTINDQHNDLVTDISIGSGGHKNVTGISIDPSSYITVDSTNINVSGNGLSIDGGSHDTITNNTITSTSGKGDGIKFTNVSDSTIGGNKGKDGNSIDGFATGVDVTGKSKNIFVENNTISDTNKAGINVDGGKDITISHNLIKDVSDIGINVDGTKCVTIYDNVIKAAQQFLVLIEGPVFGGSGNGVDGIKLSDVTYAKVNDNKITDFATGIDVVHHSSQIIVDKNKINDSTIAGINVDDSNNIKLFENHIYADAGDGIDVSNSSHDLIDSNWIKLSDQNYGYPIVPTFAFDGEDGGRGWGGDDNSGNVGIKLSNVSDTKLKDNHIDNFATGIDVVHHSKYVTVEGNHIKNSTIAGINVDDSHNIKLLKNYITVEEGDGIDVSNSSHDTIFGNWIDTAKERIIYVDFASDDEGDSNNNYSYNTGDVGIKLSHVSDTTVNDNHIKNFATGIDVLKDSRFVTVDSNHIKNSTIAGINVDGSKHITLDTNHIYAESGDGIDASDSSHLTIDNNWIKLAGGNTGGNQGGEPLPAIAFFDEEGGSDNEGAGAGKDDGNAGNVGIKLSDVSDSKVNDNHIHNFATGIEILNNSSYIKVDGNHIKGSTIAGINVDDSNHIKLIKNHITVAQGDGIDASNSSHLKIDGNWIKVAQNGYNNPPVTDEFRSDIEEENNNEGDYGIKLSNVSDSKVNGNHIKDFATGIDVIHNSNHITVDGNHIKGSTVDAINVDHSRNFTLSDNKLSQGEGNGINLSKDKGVIEIIGNIITGFDIGVNVFKTNNVQFASNVITGFNGAFDLNLETGKIALDGGSIGVKLTDSDGAQFSGDSFIDNVVGLYLKGSSNTTVEGASFTGNDVAFLAVDGKGKHHSSNELVGDSTFDNDTLGVVLDGPFASMQFDPSAAASYFNGEQYYFILVNGAMDGGVLNASQQYFEGNLAAEFSFGPYGELAQAEARTIDIHNSLGVGLVFYRLNPFAFDDNANGDNFFNQLEDLAIGRPHFSYAGQTFGKFVPSFSIPEVNLSLLASGGNVTFANLSPAAGGNTTPNSSNTVDLASLSPSAGGNDSCGNGFLGGGYSIGYSTGSCTAK